MLVFERNVHESTKPGQSAVGVAVFSVVVSLLIQPLEAQYFTAVNGRCDPRAFYNLGICRQRACPSTETYLPGNSYCDVFSRANTPVVRCVASLPCCVWGGECRQSCSADQNQLDFRTDCGVNGRGVCCVDTGQTRIAAPPSESQRPTLPPVDLNITEQQGQCRSNPIVSTRILGGTPVTPGDWAWMVRLVYPGRQRSVCSGVLVSDDTVLTPGHCVNGAQPQDIQIHVGDFDLTQTEVDEELIPLSNIFHHRDFVMGSLGNDFAILKLSRPVRQGSTVVPACLPDPRMSLVTGRDAQCFVAGWGTDDNGRVSPTLRAARVNVIDMSLCQAMLNSITGNNSQLPPDVICTVSASAERSGPCLFDDGGMLACADLSGRYTFTGLVSQYSCGNLPTVYTRIDTYISSILRAL